MLKNICIEALLGAGIYADADGPPDAATEAALVAEIARASGVTAEAARQALRETIGGILADMIKEATQ